ncbi:peptidoglycan -binding protein [Parvibaculum sp.]|uniref:peptidoglycan -binding protein n=1 Tax=Parvibaculum sp. TaxID=2024848 RepID=UPI001B124594|nr:peptidoglycan -binding protein [Parvibaculum sp.]MBO6633795.1 peptidoglycan -binding protein [Parvibaculum sp.]MBO6679472.1 peptidoglycan -binding protein [Parvibaculum sp.]MBO6685603.1 peptidoglycan -binding protein [Parvibaculum sp.]MBO6906229.1 peptidoglycan -binding protein [Parvibaculum sp.]
MANVGRRIRGRAPTGDYWPGFVDAMSSLLLVLIFLLTIFMITQFFLNQLVSSKDSALENLRSQIAELVSQLALERRENADLQATIMSLQDSLAAASAEQERLAALADQGAGAGSRIAELESALSDEKKVSSEALAQVELLNQQISALRRQLATLEAALEAAEQKDREQQVQIADLGRRLNAALAQKVQELAKYRSEFFGRLRAILGDRQDIEIVGDRFAMQSEIFFESGSADINPEGKQQLDKIAAAVREIAAEIPDDIPWVLRVDGHTDSNPISTPQFPSNWYLSSARAIAVVNYLTERGVPQGRLVAAGFGQFHPLTDGTSPSDNRRNRRIEFKLTER